MALSKTKNKKSSRRSRSSTKKTCPSTKVLNPKSGRCVSKTGRIGRKLSETQNNKLIRRKSRISNKRRRSRRGSVKKTCPPNKVLNPKTGRYVSKTGKIGKRLYVIQSKKSKKRRRSRRSRRVRFSFKGGIYGCNLSQYSKGNCIKYDTAEECAKKSDGEKNCTDHENLCNTSCVRKVLRRDRLNAREIVRDEKKEQRNLNREAREFGRKVRRPLMKHENIYNKIDKIIEK